MGVLNDIAAVEDYERHARVTLADSVYAHIAGGSGDESALERNREQLRGYRIVPRVLRDVTHGSTGVDLLGERHAHPILLAPVAFQQLAHAEGELATAVGADVLDTTMILSTLSSATLERVAKATPGRKWFQLYFQPERDATLDLVRRAEESGYSALVVTVDAPVQAMHNRADRAGFALPRGIVAANLQPGNDQPVVLEPQDSRVFQGVMRAAPRWPDIEWLRTQTRLPMLVKGILHPDDAQCARGTGADGIVVSNHGGRALDQAPAPLDALPAIRERVGDGFPLLVDGGMRRGGDIFIALALGANAVLVGRPQVFALAVAGARGVAHMLRILRDELEVTMALAGCASIADITATSVERSARW